MNSSAGALFLWQHFDTWLSFVVRYPYMSEHTRNETGGILDAVSYTHLRAHET